VAKDGESLSPLESRTRSRVLRAVSARGPVTAAELGRLLELTPAAVRRHLDVLVEQGAITEHESTAAPRGRGRPARAYVMGEAGHEALGTDYDSLALEVLHHLTAQLGSGAVAEFVRERLRGTEERYAERLATVGDDPAARAELLVEALTEDGFAASARPVGSGGFSGVQLCQGHCPVRHVAAQFPEFCEAETDAFSRLLGVHVQRLATLAGGDHVCTTFIPTAELSRPAGGSASAGPTEHIKSTPGKTTHGMTDHVDHSTDDHTKEGSTS
jgi:predicted ArsR family transcriptional regulator